MATRAVGVGYDQLHHFVATGVWDSAPLEAALLSEADRLVSDKRGFLVIDDAALPKRGGTRSGSHRNTRPRSARRPTASRWSLSAWRLANCR